MKINVTSSNKRWFTALYAMTAVFVLTFLGKPLNEESLTFLGTFVPVFLINSQWGETKRHAQEKLSAVAPNQ
jgi:hypothetical protein